jgi:IclR family KDG regulon transcriptional repressor
MRDYVMEDKTVQIELIPNHSDRYRILSVQRAAQVLSAFLTPPHEFGVSELSRMLGQTKNQTFRLLQTLVDERLVIFDLVSKRYRLGYRVVELGVVAQNKLPLVAAAAPVMDEVAAESGETINLGTLADEVTAICLDKRESAHPLQIHAQVGGRFPLHAGAISKLLLAYSPDEFLDEFFQLSAPLDRFTANTIVEPDLLRAELRAIRGQGYAISDEDLDLGACSVAAPIRNGTGEVIAGISIAAPKARFGAAERERNTQRVVAAAEDISRKLRGDRSITVTRR